MLEQETNETRSMIAERMADPETSAIENRNINEVFSEEEDDAIFAAALHTALLRDAEADAARPGRSMTVSRYFPAADPVPHADLAMPRGYVLQPRGVYKICQEEEGGMSLLHVTSIPFFIAEKTENGKVLIVRKINNMWLQDLIPGKSIMARGTYFDLMIFPTERSGSKHVIDYALASMLSAPFVSAPDAALQAVLAAITEQHILDDSMRYPILVNVSSIKEICEQYEMKYNTVRTWLSRRDVIEHDAEIQRDRTSGKPTRFLVFKKPLANFIEN